MTTVLTQYNITFKIANDIVDEQISTVKLRAHQENIEKVLQCLIQSGVYHIEIDYYDPLKDDPLKEYRDQQMAQTIKDPNHTTATQTIKDPNHITANNFLKIYNG